MKQHAIFECKNDEVTFKCDVPFVEGHGDHGLPPWFFDNLFDSDSNHYFINVEIDEATGVAEFIPAIGPAPCWRHETAANLPRMEMLALLEDWFKEIF